MYSKNEWDTLKKVVVGIADYAKVPEIDISLRTINYADVQDETSINSGLYPRQVVDEANEDLEIFSNFLRTQGVEVVRPTPSADCEYYNYCPRDNVVVHDNLALATPMPLISRKNEYLAFAHHLTNIKNIPCSYNDNLYNVKCLGDPDVLALTEYEPAFDAANIIRANNDLLYLVSNSGNKKGAQLLQELVGNDVTVHTLEGVYSYMHIDSTVAFLKEGLMLLNPSRIKSIDQLPKAFQNWDVIWCPEPVPIGHHGNYKHSSDWISMNLFSVNPNLVAVEEHQTPLRKELEKYNIECAMLPMRHSVTLGGCFHCVTLDLERQL
jgi:N-dimethylarginine dimethylaminohydrolase